ncbi:MAG: hypothetical protein KAJ56_03555, partial [Candidatus Aenigmarchaeota archaeon]|nr:hypothetical protein [Candidatus Aenigmarchaeota archaeon]
FFYYDFDEDSGQFMLNGLLPVKNVDASFLDKLQKSRDLAFSDFKDIMNSSMPGIQGDFEEKVNEWAVGLTNSFDPDKLSWKIYNYLEKYPMPDEFNFDGISFMYNLSTGRSGLILCALTPESGVKAKSAGKLQKNRGITLSGFKESLYSVMEEYNLNATLVVADDLDKLLSYYAQGESHSDYFNRGDLEKSLDNDPSKFDENYTGFCLYNNTNNFLVIYRNVKPEAVIVDTSVRRTELSAEEVISYF